MTKNDKIVARKVLFIYLNLKKRKEINKLIKLQNKQNLIVIIIMK